MQRQIDTNQGRVVVLAQTASTERESGDSANMPIRLARVLIGLGVTQIAIGVLCVTFQGVALKLMRGSDINIIGHGVWSGLMFLITGSFGIAGGINRRKWQVYVVNVLSILSALAAVCLIGIPLTGVLCGIQADGCDISGQTELAMEVMLIILGAAECAVAIASSVASCTIGPGCCDCCGSYCCPPSSPQNQIAVVGQLRQSQRQNFSATQQRSDSNRRRQIFTPNRLSTTVSKFLHKSQQPPLYLQQVTCINLDPPRQHMVRYHRRQENPPPPGSNRRRQIFTPNQPSTIIVPHSQQPKFLSKSQHPPPYSQQVINLDPRQHMVRYHRRQENPPQYGQQSNV